MEPLLINIRIITHLRLANLSYCFQVNSSYFITNLILCRYNVSPFNSLSKVKSLFFMNTSISMLSIRLSNIFWRSVQK